MSPTTGDPSTELRAGYRAPRAEVRCDARVYTSLAMTNGNFRAFFLLISCMCLAGGVAAQSGFVHTSGADLVDGQGKTLMLRGTNVGNWLEPEGYMFHLGDTAQSPREIEELS